MILILLIQSERKRLAPTELVFLLTKVDIIIETQK